MSDSEKDNIIKSNDTFYKALGTRDLELMNSIWVTDKKSSCVHPGWVMFYGWESIKQSWENVFDPNDQVDIKLTNISLEVKGNVAWLTCIQHLTYIKRDPMMANVSQSTNIFEKKGPSWLMVLHHASPIAITDYEVPNTTLQ